MASPVKKMFRLVAVLAVLHMLGLVGFAAYLFATGSLTRERLVAALAVLRADETGEEEDAGEVPEEQQVAATSEESIAREQTEEEIHRRAIRRGLSELRNKRVAVTLVMQRALADKERLEKQRLLHEAAARQREVEGLEEGFTKTVEYLESLKPAVAKDLLLFGNSEEEAARTLLKLDTRKGKKIIEAAIKDEGTKARMQKVFQMVRDLAPPDSEWSGVQLPEGAE